MLRCLATVRQLLATELDDEEVEVADSPARVERKGRGAREAARLDGAALAATPTRITRTGMRHLDGVVARAGRRWLLEIAETLGQRALRLTLPRRCLLRTRRWPSPTAQ